MLHSKKNEKTPNTFVDGVPVKISEQYKPPVKVTLPFSCQNCTPSDSLYTEYDFRLENRVLDKLTEWKKTHKEELERRKERLKRKKECGAGVPSGPAASAKQPERHHLDNLIDDTSCADLKLQKANSKSVPDIVSELQKELEESRERDAERRLMTISSGNQKLPESAKQEKKPYRKLSDPTSRLKPELLRLAEHISEMGFPLPRVARACAFFEGDDKKVIEFLLQVQSLEEKNFPGDLVERALHANNFSTEESVKYLNSLMVLLDLGFDEAKVEEALKKTNSDRDKALDMLIS
ncbi:UNVERIFIED_CONTAM: hypothetical protein PYX00_008679 [Menopon gallinae]|uniref:Ubiquitin-associated protein 1 n=1 Tax=Menopon gallinae TaxID=328185 RepID=A0AAW2HPV6_9NEOP